ncbi:MAG: hypothetical protein R3B70_36880 [Polyangiaceae bacterium]
MFTSRLVLALTVGLGLSLSACVGGQSSDFDVQMDAPSKKAMGNGGGLNGGLPAAVGPCIDGIALAAHSVVGDDGSGNLNSDIHGFRCAGYKDPGAYDYTTDGPDYLNRPLDFVPPPWPQTGNEIVETMVWAGVSEHTDIEYTNPAGTFTYTGEGFLDTHWESTKIQQDDAVSDFISVVVAKLNAYPIPVPILLEGDSIIRDDPQGEYTVLESAIVAKVRRQGRSARQRDPVLQGQPRRARVRRREHLLRRAHLPRPRQRVLRAQHGCLARGDVKYHCVNDQGAPAKITDSGVRCNGRPLLRVWVKPGALAADPASPCHI